MSSSAPSQATFNYEALKKEPLRIVQIPGTSVSQHTRHTSALCTSLVTHSFNHPAHLCCSSLQQAGAGNSTFHTYRAARPKEQQRLAEMDQQEQQHKREEEQLHRKEADKS